MAFVSPESVLPRVVEQLRLDINPELVNALSETDFGIWATPEGTTYIDGNIYSTLSEGKYTQQFYSSSRHEERSSGSAKR